MVEICSFAECTDQNCDTHALTKDHFGLHFFCQKHWSFITFLFDSLVKECVNQGKSGCCKRNHFADYSSGDTVFNTVKFSQKNWDLCNTHFATYDEILGILLLPDYD